MLLTLFLGFLLGALTVLILQAFGILIVINRLSRRTKEAKERASARVCRDLDPQQSIEFSYNKQGVVWVLESEKVAKNWVVDKASKEQKRKKEILEVSPVRKYAKIKDRCLTLTDADGSQSIVRLKGCTIAAVSAISLSSRKWAKRYPIKVESKTSVLYSGSKIFYIYLETSWEKESWCKALRLASLEDKEKIKWFSNLSMEFRNYLASLNAGYPSFMKPIVGFYAEPVERENRFDGSSSKVRLFWKKLAKKASKAGENKSSWTTLSLGRDERKISEKSRSFQDLVSAAGMIKTAPTEKILNSSVEENIVLPSSSTFTRSGSQSYISVNSEADADDKFGIDEGTLCWNLLISRLFFDAKNNAEMRSSMQARIQRTLSNMRTPTYVGEVLCSGIDLGSLPPYIHGMRVLPTDMNELWALEIDIEYSGGAVLDIETRLEVRELEYQKGLVDTNLESGSVGQVTSDLLEEYLGKQLKLPEETVDGLDNRDDRDPKMDGLKSTKSTLSTSTCVSRWKSILNSVAKQVSQVPIYLAIRVVSLRGTMRLHIKPPPSDQLWFGFTSMPDIDFNLESAIGDHKITSGRIALFLINRFKAAIRETLVLPNCESICISWMLAEKDDWVPRKDAPFIWLNPEAVSDRSSQPGEAAKTNVEAVSTDDEILESTCESSAISSKPPTWRSSSKKSGQELTTPLLTNDEVLQETREENTECVSSSSRSSSNLSNQASTGEEPKKVGRRAKMLDLGKKMSEKLEEKRRHIEEKSRNIVDKMRGPQNSQ